MFKFFWSVLLISPMLLVSQWVGSNSAIAKEINHNFDQTDSIDTTQLNLLADSTVVEAQSIAPTPIPTNNSAQNTEEILEQLNQYSREGKTRRNSVGQVNSVGQLRDVSPGDWAFEALRNLVERYDCIEGYPNRTYRGNRSLSRYEFAAGLNACLSVIERLIIESGTGISSEELQRIQRLGQEFEAELATLGARVDNLEGRVAFLEDHQFSTTTKLKGEVVFAIADEFSESDGGNNTTFSDRVRLSFVTSFTGKDSLITRLDAGNTQAFDAAAFGDQGAFTFTTNSNNDVGIGWLAYYFPIGDKIQVYLPAAFPLWQDFVPTVSPYFEGFTGATAALSSFGESSPIYKIGLGAGGGIGINFNLAESLMLSVGYFGGNSFNPADGQGLFNGEYSALGQLTWTPNDKFQFAVTYANAYFNDFDSPDSQAIFDTGPGTFRANRPFGIGGDITTVVNAYGVEASYILSPRIAINAFGLFMDASQTSGGGGDAEIWSYGGGIAFPDLFGEGNLGGIIVGAEPYVTDCDGGTCGAVDDDVALHIEGFYKYQLNDNISITPGLIVLTAPFGNNDNNEDFIGVVRTTFEF